MIDNIGWRGIFPSLPTVFDEAGEVDSAGYRAVTRFALDGGAHGIVCFGLAGEVNRLTIDERERLLEVAVDEVNSEVPVLVGATAENLVTSSRLARHAERVGADGIVMPSPTAYRLEENDVVDFFVEVASVTSLPAMIQDAHQYLGVALRPEAVLAASSRASNICGVKLEAAGEGGIDVWSETLGHEFMIFGGSGGMFLLECLRAGVDGVIPAVDTIDLQVEIYAAEVAGDHERAEELFSQLLPMLVFEMQSIDHCNACVKHILRRRGIDISTELRSPGLRRLGSTSVRRLDAYFDQFDLGG